MEARYIRTALLVSTLLSLGASYRTENFIVTAGNDQLAQAVATAAEQYRRDLAIEWLGRELPAWRDKCPIRVNAGPQLGAGGVTQFMFEGRQPFGWSMTVQGTPERILDSVLPHEITHTIFATHFGRPLPRWADEGACTTVEHEVERRKQHRLLYEFLTTGRGIAFNQMFAMKEYPPDVLPLYSQGYSLARFLIAQGGKQKFIKYVGDGMDTNNWPDVTRLHYGYRDLSELQLTWLEWVRQGSGPLPNRETQIAQAAVPPIASPENGSPQASTAPQSVAVEPSPLSELAAAMPPIADSADSPSGFAAATRGNLASAPAAGPTQLAAVSPASAPSSTGEATTPQAGQQAAGQIVASPLAAGASGGNSSGSSRGWYARVRDQVSPQGQAARAAAGVTTPETPPVTRASQSGLPVARPQSPQQAEQVVLEWSRGNSAPGAERAAESPRAAEGEAARSYLLSSEQFRQSVLR